MAAHTPRIEEHPDLMALRADSERAVTKPIAQAVESLMLLTGLYLAISPWVVGFDSIRSLTVSNLITGAALAMLALGYGPAYERTHAMSWAAAVIGVWTIIAPWVVVGNAATSTTKPNNIATGAVAIVLALAAIAQGMSGRASRGMMEPMR